VTADDIERDRLAAVRALASRARAIVVLKGPFSLVASPDGRVVVNSSGNAALATAGSGDVLAGIVGALACALDPFDAACAGVYVHGLAAEAWSRAHEGADRGMIAGDIADECPAVLGSLGAHAR
jgi:NAD(P)H-hydrate epimerase